MTADIRKRAWLAERLGAGVTVTEIAAEAGVSRQTAHTWLHRHQLESVPKAKPRPMRDDLLALYALHGSAAGVADELGVGRDTARRWLIAAGADLGGVGRRPASLDVTVLLRRREEGASVVELAAEFGVAPETIRRRLNAAG
jgi:transposase-like protein